MLNKNKNKPNLISVNNEEYYIKYEANYICEVCL